MNPRLASFGLASFDGLEIAYATRGDGPDILLMHGFAASRWRTHALNAACASCNHFDLGLSFSRFAMSAARSALARLRAAIPSAHRGEQAACI